MPGTATISVGRMANASRIRGQIHELALGKILPAKKEDQSHAQ